MDYVYGCLCVLVREEERIREKDRIGLVSTAWVDCGKRDFALPPGTRDESQPMHTNRPRPNQRLTATSQASANQKITDSRKPSNDIPIQYWFCIELDLYAGEFYFFFFFFSCYIWWFFMYTWSLSMRIVLFFLFIYCIIYEI